MNREFKNLQKYISRQKEQIEEFKYDSLSFKETLENMTN